MLLSVSKVDKTRRRFIDDKLYLFVGKLTIYCTTNRSNKKFKLILGIVFNLLACGFSDERAECPNEMPSDESPRQQHETKVVEFLLLFFFF